MSSITREEIIDQDLGEEEQYQKATPTEAVLLPLTRLGFEALIKKVTDEFKLPLDDAARAVLAGYIHHIPNIEHTTTLETLGRVLHKSVSNFTTWTIDQELKIKKAEKLQALKKEEETELEKKRAEKEQRQLDQKTESV